MEDSEDLYLSLTTETNAIDYLTRACEFIKETQKNKLAWKWVSIALHGALYGFSICALEGGNPRRVTYCTKKGEEKLISFEEALKYTQGQKHMGMFVMSKPLQLSDCQKESIRILKDMLRNNFEHYTPKHWGIFLDGMPKMSIDVLEVIRFLALGSGNCILLTSAQRSSINEMINETIIILKESKLYKEAISQK
jgi:hypothetical protein